MLFVTCCEGKAFERAHENDEIKRISQAMACRKKVNRWPLAQAGSAGDRPGPRGATSVPSLGAGTVGADTAAPSIFRVYALTKRACPQCNHCSGPARPPICPQGDLDGRFPVRIPSWYIQPRSCDNGIQAQETKAPLYKRGLRTAINGS